MKATYCDNRTIKAQKFFSVVLAVLVATVAIFPLSAFSAGVVPSPVTSILNEPIPVFTSDTLEYYIVYYHASEPHYRLNHITITFSDSSQTFWDSEGTFLFSSGPYDSKQEIIDVETGVLLNTLTGAASYNSYRNRYQKAMQSSDVNVSGLYFIAPSELTISYSDKVVDPFVTWSTGVPDQTQYRSSLPCPQWDIHNRYIVIDDKLYWISYYVDNLWINPITGSATVSSDDHTAVVTGNASDPNDGDIYYNYNISIRYQDKDYYCLQYNSVNYSNESMCAPCLVYNSSGSRLTISFDQLSGIYSSIADILVDYRIYCSSFDLITGEYIESIYAANGQQGNAEININIDCPDEISSVYCYGVDFVNSQNLPVNLASVIWSYDLDYAQWRSDISSKLDAIYALLSQSSVPSTTASLDYASMLNPEPTVSGYNAEDAGSLLAGAVSDVNVELGDGMEWGRNQVNDFATGVPELFLVVILALAFGLTIMILGKKKSDN